MSGNKALPHSPAFFPICHTPFLLYLTEMFFFFIVFSFTSPFPPNVTPHISFTCHTNTLSLGNSVDVSSTGAEFNDAPPLAWRRE